jgi:hypothetical protein
MSKCLVCGIILLASSVCVAADAAASPKDTPAVVKEAVSSPSGGLNDIVLPSKDTSEYWVIRSYTVNELTAFLTKKRAEMKTKLGYFKSCIEQIGKTQDMLAADVKGVNDPALRAKAMGVFDTLEAKGTPIPPRQLSWDEVVEIGMKFEVSEGYSPIELEGQELDEFKSILKNKEQLCIKVRKETTQYADTIVKAWLYLGSIDKQKEFRYYVMDQKQQKEKVEEDKRMAYQQQQLDTIRQRNAAKQDAIWQEREQARKDSVEARRQADADARGRQRRLMDDYSQNGYSY